MRRRVRLQPHVTIAQGPAVDRALQGALFDLQQFSDQIADCLDQVLWPLAPRIGHHAVHALIHETRRDARQLAACHTPGGVYVEELTVTEPGDGSLSIEVEGSFGAPTG